MIGLQKIVVTNARRPQGRLARGFTLVELLVVIAIIAVLTTIGLASFQSAAKTGRDGKRKGDLSQVRAALELYRSQAGSYPAGNYSGMITALKAAPYQYIADPTPQDPKNGYSYTYTGAGAPPASYVLCAHLETLNTGNSSRSDSINASGSLDYICVTQP